MDLIQLAIILIVVGFLFWIGNALIPMNSKVRQVINIIAFIAFVLWLGRLFGGRDLIVHTVF